MILALWLLGCGASEPEERALTVLAASSLTDAFTELERHVELTHGIDVTVSFGGSQTVATWLREGAAADAVATANLEHLQALHAEGLVTEPVPIATNRLVLVVADRGEARPTLATLDTVERLVVGSPEVPVGQYTEALLDAAELEYGADWRAAVDAHVVSREPNVRQVAAKVALGEADAAIVYATDAAAVKGVRAISLPVALAAPTHLYQARLTRPAHPAEADLWVQTVRGDHGQRVLAGHGFAPPAR